MIPARVWRAAHERMTDDDSRRIGQWLGVPECYFARLPFVRLDTDEGEALACAFDPPKIRPARRQVPFDPDDVHSILDAMQGEWDTGLSDTSDVLVWRPDGCSLLGDYRKNQLAGGHEGGAAQVFTHGTAYLRAWAERRYHHWLRCQRMGDFFDASCLPGYLLIGDPARVQWPRIDEFIAPPEMTAKLSGIIMRQARLPRVTASQIQTRRAA